MHTSALTKRESNNPQTYRRVIFLLLKYGIIDLNLVHRNLSKNIYISSVLPCLQCVCVYNVLIFEKQDALKVFIISNSHSMSSDIYAHKIAVMHQYFQKKMVQKYLFHKHIYFWEEEICLCHSQKCLLILSTFICYEN